MNTLIIGGTGLVGGQIRDNLLAQGERVRVMSRRSEAGATLPPGAEAIVGNLADPPSLHGLLNGIDNVVLITAMHPDETAHGLTAVKAAKRSGIKKIVYMSVIMPEGSTQIPHFASKIPIEQAIKDSGMAFTILRPNNFFQNDYLFKDAILKMGFYPQPIGGLGVNRVDTRDIADAAVISLFESGHDGKTYNISGPDALTGRETARIYGKHLGSEVNYAGDDLEAWASAVSEVTPAWLVYDSKIMYKFFQDHGLKSSPADASNLENLLRHPARKFDSFAAELIAEWKN